MCARVHVRDPRSWLRMRRELSSSLSQTHLIYGGWLQVLSGLVQQCCSWRLSSWRLCDPTKSSVLKFTATEAVRSDPADDKHKPGLIFFGLCELQRKQDPWHGSCTEERMSSLEILMKWHLKKKKKSELHKEKPAVFGVLPHLLQTAYTLPLRRLCCRNWKASLSEFAAAADFQAMVKCRKTLDF